MKKSTQIILILVTILFVAAVVFGGYALVGKINDANNEINSLKNQISNYENKENVNTNESSNNVNSIPNSTDNSLDANEAIKKALKDESWIKKNIIPVMFEQNDNVEELYNKHTFYFEKIENTEIPTYIVEAKDSYILEVLVSYKDSKVTVSKKYIEVSAIENASANVDVQNKLVTELPDSYDTKEKIYTIKNGEFEPVLNWEAGAVENGVETRNYYYEGKKIESEEYDKKVDEYTKKYNFKEVSKKITNENVDKYVK